MHSSQPPDDHLEPTDSAASAKSTATGGEVAGERTAADKLAAGAAPVETRGARFARRAHRVRLYFSVGAAIVLLVYLIALVSANTRHVKVSWAFGTSSVSLIWLVLCAAILGLLLGMVIGALFHWRTRQPRQAKPIHEADSKRRR
ncbi:MAG: hypothetical protein ACLQUT_04385 [Thermoleophilia bacterium]